MQELESGDRVRQVTMALKLIIDAGLPVTVRQLEKAMYANQTPKLDEAIEAAVEMLMSQLPPSDQLPWEAMGYMEDADPAPAK